MFDRFDSSYTYNQVCTIVATRLRIDVDAIHPEFRVRDFLRGLRNYRMLKTHAYHRLYYIESVKIFVDIANIFCIDFPYEFAEEKLITVADIVDYIDCHFQTIASQRY
jgi:hypothetical protein